uniref:Integral membrane protein n=1 Tax=Mycena chlorophos TaxID=658473 RepID=A0ABQ0M1I3_MYCCL|nr:predicted protein [Mycena chlorophos]
MSPQASGLAVASVISESVVFGAFLVLFCIGMAIRVARFDAERGDCWLNPVVVCTLAIFSICTTHWSISLTRFLRALSREGPFNAFTMDSLRNINATLTIVSLWFGDAFMIHRLWVIWDRRPKLVVLPVTFFVGMVASGILSIITLWRHSTENEATTTVIWLLRLFTNGYCTTFIAWRLWYAREIETGPASQLRILTTLLAVTIESAAVLAAWTIFYAVTNQMASQLNTIASTLTPQIIGLTNMSIQIRIGLGWSPRGSGSTSHESGMVMTSIGSMARVNFHFSDEEASDAQEVRDWASWKEPEPEQPELDSKLSAAWRDSNQTRLDLDEI